jgi:uncharacterized protein YyaL (SSP411 family)
MPNRLAGATSPYLLQHADNPVDWWEWSDAAFEEAARRDVPVLLSVGYAACHWCHVMAHESFEDVATASQVNAGFVAVKVDREERPDIDAVYMAATQAMTGQGGWPMTCFLTPAGEPFHCGTYYPTVHFRRLLAAVTQAWTDDGARVRSSAGQIAARLADNAAAALPPAGLDTEALEAAVQELVGEFDAVNGGFGGAPKFPPSMTMEFLLRHHERTGSGQALHLAAATAGRMARGGMYDQLAGGFARYSVDARWVVPHFEKMLYDNALLLRGYAHLARIAGPHAALARRVTEETAEFLLRDLRTPEGGFASALDADTDGVEGLTYAWTPAELTEVLGEQDGAWAAQLLAVTPEGTFEHGSSTLQLPADPDDPARWRRIRSTLLAARNRRPQPTRDDKVVTAWNGMAVLALAEAGAALGRPDWVRAADATVDLLLERHVVDGRVRRSSRDGTVGVAAGVLEDHAFLAEALLTLHQATGAAHRLQQAVEVLDLTLAHFADPVTAGAFFDTADDAEALLHRPREITDNATPSGAAALAGALLTASVLVEDPQRYRVAAEAALRTAGGLARRFPRFAGHWLTVAEAAVRGPLQVAVVGVDTGRDVLAGHARAIAPGGTVVVAGAPDAPGVPLLAHRPLVDGVAAAYVCRGFICDRPVTTVEELTAALLLTP